MKPPRKMPDWAYNQMIDGLQKLLVLRLQGAPPADTINAVAMVWEEALTPHTWAFVPEYDAERLPNAFRQLIQQAERWVQPAQLIRHIPPRDEYLMQIEYKPPTISSEERERNRAYIRDILNHLLKEKKQ